MEVINEIIQLIKEIKSYLTPGMRKSNYGRLDGWYIEFEGKVIGELIDYQWSDMFWDNYQIVSKDKSCNETLSNEYLWNEGKFEFRNRRTSQIVKYVMPSQLDWPARRILLRYLYLGK